MKTGQYTMKSGIFQIEKNKCDSCGGCVAVCPNKVIVLITEGQLEANKNKCIGCKSCVLFCPMGALKVQGKGELATQVT